MSTAPYMPLFVADYLADTAHLSAAEHGAYMLLIMNYWQRGKALPSDDRKLARIARMSDSEWSSSRDTLAEFFQDEAGEWRHARIDRELAIVSEKSAKARASARVSASVRSANAQQSLSEREAIRLGEDREEKKDIADDDAQASASVHLADQCLEAAGLSNDPKAVLWPIRPIANCIRDGAILAEDVLPTIRRLRAEGRRFGSWAYPCQAIMDAKASREAPAPLGRATGPPYRPPTAGEQAERIRQHIERVENERIQRQAGANLVLTLVHDAVG
jgi:uncharacterized protein YdaU (DUF1376 family)